MVISISSAYDIDFENNFFLDVHGVKNRNLIKVIIY